MPGEPLTPAAIGLTGKLPAHGDFVRRGDPVVTGRYDRWLADALADAASVDRDALMTQMEELPSWRFMTTDGDMVIAGAMIASNDKVGRLYPLVGFALLPGASRLHAETWSAQAESALTHARNALKSADGLAAALAAIMVEQDPDPDPDPVRPGTAWWRASAATRVDGPDHALPTGPDFALLLAGDTVCEPEDVRS